MVVDASQHQQKFPIWGAVKGEETLFSANSSIVKQLSYGTAWQGSPSEEVPVLQLQCHSSAPVRQFRFGQTDMLCSVIAPLQCYSSNWETVFDRN